MWKKLLIVAVLTIGAVSIADLVLAASASSLTDNFDDNSFDGAKWGAYTTTGSTVTETGRSLVLSVPNRTNASEATVFALAGNSLVNDTASVNFIAGASGSVDTIYQFSIDGSNAVKFLWSGGTLTARKTVADVDTDSTATVAPGPNTWLRFRETGGTLFWEYSTDNQANWTTLRSEADPIDLTFVNPHFSVYEWASTVGPTPTIFDNFNVGVCDPTTTYCQTIFAQAGYDEWTVPANVTTADVACIGAGGGGGDGTNTGGGGGGGAAFASSTLSSLSAGTKYTVFVGAGGLGATTAAGNGFAGATTTFATTTVIAAPGWGGKGGSAADTAGGLPGTTASSTGTTKFAGGLGGGSKNTGDTSGGGGGSAGPNGAGGNGSDGVTNGAGGAGGTGGNTAGGTGGAGGNIAIGADGSQNGRGGGGGGGGDDGLTGGMGGWFGAGGGGGEANGANGAAGACIISYAGTAPIGGDVTTNPYNTIIFE